MEATFMQAVIQAANEQWRGNEDELLNQLLPTIGDHPYRDYLLTTSQDVERVTFAREEVLENLWSGEVELHVRNVFDQFYYLGDKKAYNNYLYAARIHAGDIYTDLIAGEKATQEEKRKLWIRRMQRVAPHQPCTIARSLYYDWPYVADRLEELENRYQQSEEVQLALGRMLTRKKMFVAAERCLKRRMELLPNGDAYNALSNFYKQTEQMDKWLATMIEFLDTEDAQWIQGSGARIEIARYYMGKKEWEQAKPYAYKAAENSSGVRAFFCAKDCAEGLGDLETAENYVRQISRRSQHYRTLWHKWCKRFNSGQLEEARELALEHLDSIEAPTRGQWLDVIVIYHLLEDAPEEALSAIEKSFEGQANPYAGLYLAIIADELDMPEKRDKAIRHIVGHGNEYRMYNTPRHEMVKLAKELQPFYASNGEKELDLAKIDRILKQSNSWEKSNIEYFVGRVLLQHGKAEDAVKYLTRSARSNHENRNRSIAAALLHERGIDFRNTDQRVEK